MPVVVLEDLKPGETIVVSSTKGARADQITAIMLLANAEMLVRMATMGGPGGRQSRRGGGGSPAGTSGPGGGGLAGLDLSGMIP